MLVNAGVSRLLVRQSSLKRVAMLTDGGVGVAHRAFHRWKRPAQRAVMASSKAAPHKAKVVVHKVMRFLRFQAPWAYGRNVFALLRKAPAENWADIRSQRMNAAEKMTCTQCITMRRRAENGMMSVLKTRFPGH